MDAWLAFWTALWVGSEKITRRLVDWLCNAQPEAAKAPKKPETDTGESDEQPEPDTGEQQPKAPKKTKKTPEKKPADQGEGSALLRWCMVMLAAVVAKTLPYTTAITITLAAVWIVTALVLGYAATLPDKPEPAADEQQDTPAEAPPADQPHPSETLTLGDVALLLTTVYTEGSGVHLAALAEHLDRTPYMGHPAAPWATRDVRALLTRHGVRVRDGVRVPPKGGREGVHRDDFPPIPPPDPAPTVVGDVAAGQSNNNNVGNSLSPYPFEVTDDPNNPARSHVHHPTDERGPMPKKTKQTCQTCGTRDETVQTMPDPMAEALEPERTDHEQMTLCHPCAVARFEES
ncbi:hypothetical protein [Streptomyces sp. NPDC102437]|uniref:hypothetical protein n=1 Tax=Streptomyces sp. NPDC102437 TaxID=3366175 RepID=UPI0037F73D23